MPTPPDCRVRRFSVFGVAALGFCCWLALARLVSVSVSFLVLVLVLVSGSSARSTWQGMNRRQARAIVAAFTGGEHARLACLLFLRKMRC